MPKRGSKSTSVIIREKIDVLDEENSAFTTIEFPLKISTPLFGIITGKLNSRRLTQAISFI